MDYQEMVVIEDSLIHLDYLEEVMDLSASVKDQIQTLKIELRFLRVFFRCIKTRYIRESWSDRVKNIKDAMLNLVKVVWSCYVKAKEEEEDGKVSMNIDGSFTNVLQRIDSIKPEVNQCYHSITESYFDFSASLDNWAKLCDCVLENVKDLRIHSSQVTSILKVKKIIDVLERKVLFLRKSLQFIDKLECHTSDHHEEIGYLAVTAASFFFHCWMSKIDDENKELPDLSLALNYKPNSEETIVYHMLLNHRTFEENSEETLVVGYIDLLLEHLGEVQSSNGSPEIISKDQLESLRKELELLKFLHTGTPLQEAAHGISYQQRMGIQVNKAARLIEDLYVGYISEEKMMMINDDKPPQVLRRLKLINIFCGMELMNYKVTPVEDHSETLDQDMRLLREFFIDTQKGDNVKKEFMDIRTNVDAVVLEAAPVLYSLYFNETKEDMAEEMILLLPDLLEKINLIKEDMRRICQRATSFDFPKTGGQRGTTTSLKHLNKLLTERANTVSLFVKPHIGKASKLQIEYVENKLAILISFLVKLEEQYIDIRELEIRITNMADEAQRVTDPIFIRDNARWICNLKLSELLEEVKLIIKDLERIDEEISGEMLSSQENALGEVIVGFDDAGQEIIDQLVEGQMQLKVISIIGMGGLGKTTLAKKLYNDPSVVRYFDVRAWCSVSQEYRAEQMLIDILGQVSENSNVKSIQGLEERLYKCLKGRRYLIVMDDIWDIQAWTALNRCFADDGNGSRVIFTTRIKKIASNVHTRNSIPYNLRYFNEDESLVLLQKKLFPGRRCPTEQLESVKQIAKSCQGLPLAVVLMAGVLASKKREEWEKVAESLSRHTDRDRQTLSMKALELSYTNLPGYLRKCFLYFAGFPEDREIVVKKLMWLWVSEGLIQKSEQKSLEVLAKDYLMDLIGRSLVTVAEIGSSGGVKTCRIHDLLLDLSLRKAKEEKFLLLLDGKGEPSAVNQKVESSTSNPITDKRYRLCIHSMPHDFDKWSPDEDVCSLQCHLNMKLSYDASFVFSIFKFLNVLDLERLLLKDLECGIELLVQLRLLSVRIQSNSIPSAIANLTNLETLIVKGMRGEVAIPDTIWNMANLRHLHVDNCYFLISAKRDMKDVVLDKLETLSTPSIQYGENSKDAICSLLSLLKLKCVFMGVDYRNSFPELDSLIRLESLKVFYHGRKLSNGIFSFPSNLKKLTLSKFKLPWSDIATIGTLPNLEVLKLLFKAFEGKEWKTKDDEFPKLKYLKLESLDVEEWNVASGDHFPRLQKLVVHRCKRIEEIPFSFVDVNTLQTIELKWCNISAANSVQEIFNEQLDMGNESFVVKIHPNLSNQGTASSS